MTVSKSCLLLVIGLLVVSDVAVASFFSQVSRADGNTMLITCLRVLVLPPAGLRSTQPNHALESIHSFCRT